MATQLDERERDRTDTSVPAWMPARFTAPLQEPMVTDGDRLLRAVDQLWTMPDGTRLQLDDWQRWLLRALLERYPDDWPVERLRGQLRYRQAVVSMGRQNGKSVLGAILGFYGLAMHAPAPEVVGLARSREQATIVYERVRHVIRSEQLLSKRFKQTGTRGISERNGAGYYRVFPGNGDALQGIPASVCIFDELHISKPAAWSAMVKGQRARRNSLLVGITTAGDDDSELLKSLYGQGELAVAGQLERFGFFCWEAPEGSTIDTPGAIESANPAVACGRIDVLDVRSDERTTPEQDQIRYTLNRFVSSSSSWIPLTAWKSRSSSWSEPLSGTGLWFTIERTSSWEHASIVATLKRDGVIRTELVASIVAPTIDQLERLCVQLRQAGPCTFGVDSLRLKALGKRLQAKGYQVKLLTLSDQLQAAPAAYAAIVSDDQLQHAGDPLILQQQSRARRRNVSDGWRISVSDSSGDVDAVLATVAGIYLAESVDDPGDQLF